MLSDTETIYYKVDNDIELENVKSIKSVKKCTIYTKGTNKISQLYCFCSCDPNQMEQICETCAEHCHSGHDHIKSEFIKGRVKCQCGLKGHKIFKVSSIIDKKCYYHEFSQYSKKNIYYEDSKRKIICMYCKNFCLEDLAERGHKNFSRIEVSGNQTVPDCACENKTHRDLKIIFANINQISKKNHNFEGLKPIHILNLLFKSKISFNNVYSNFLSYLEKMKIEITKFGSKYEFDNNINITNFYWSLRNFSEISYDSRNSHYFAERISNLFSYDFMCDILNVTFQDKKYVWSCINMITICFKKITLGNAMYFFPNVNFEDYENMNPLQRLIIVSRVKSNKEFMEKFIDVTGNKKNIIDVMSTAIEEILLMRFVNHEAFQLLTNLFNVLQQLAKFYLFNTKQVQKYCLIIDLLFSRIKDFSTNNQEVDDDHEMAKNEENALLGARRKGYKVTANLLLIRETLIDIITNVVKTLIFLSYNYNDRVVYVCLNSKEKEVNVEGVNFYYSKNETGKNISKNCLDILHHIRIMLNNMHKPNLFSTSTNVIENLTEDDRIMLEQMVYEDFLDPEDEIEKELKDSADKNNHLKEKFSFLQNKALRVFFTLDEVRSSVPQIKKNIFKKLSNLIINATKLMKFSIGGVDPFTVGLRRCMSKNLKYNLKMIKGDISNRENEFIEYIDSLSEKIEAKYFTFFNFECTESGIIELVNASIKEIFEKFNMTMDEPISIFELQNENNGDEVVDEVDDVPNMYAKPQPTAKKIKFSHEQFQCLINKTNFIHTVMKILNFIDVKKHFENKLFDNILQLLNFYIEDSPDNCITMLNSEILHSFVQFPLNHCEKVYDLYLRLTKTLINTKVEVVSFSKCTNILTKYFLQIKKSKCGKEYEALNLLLLIIKLFIVECPSLYFLTLVAQVKQILIKLHQVCTNINKYNTFLLHCTLNSLVSTEEKEHTFKIIFDSDAHCSMDLAEIIFINYMSLINMVYDESAKTVVPLYTSYSHFHLRHLSNRYQPQNDQLRRI